VILACRVAERAQESGLVSLKVPDTLIQAEFPMGTHGSKTFVLVLVGQNLV